MPNVYGTIKALAAEIGPTGNEFVVNSSGSVNFKIDDPTTFQKKINTNYSTNIGLNISAGDKNSDALQKVDGWLSEKLILKPPSGSFRSSGQTTTLVSALNNSDTTVVISSSFGMNIGDLLLIDNEIIRLTNISKNTISFSRAYGGTSAASHIINSNVIQRGFGTTLSSAINNNVTSIDVTSASGFSVGNIIVVNSEKLLITNISTNTLTVERAVLSTAASAHNDSDTIYFLNNIENNNDKNNFYANTSYLQLFWTNPEQIDLGFLNTKVPQISNVYLECLSNNSNSDASNSSKNDNFSSGNLSSTLNGAINNSTTSVVLNDASSFSAGDIVIVDSEKMLISSISSNTLTVKRGIMGSSTATHSGGAVLSSIVTSVTLETISSGNKPKIDSVRLYLEGTGSSNPNTTLNGNITSSSTSVTLSNSTGFNRGDRINIDDEKIIILGGLTNTLSSNLNNSSTSVPVTNDGNFSVGDMIEINNEKMVVSAKPGGNVLTVTRGEDNTATQAHSSGDVVINTKITSNVVYVSRGVDSTTATSHDTGATVTSCTFNIYPSSLEILKETRYDFRIYYTNNSSIGNTNYLTYDFPELSTDSIGVPNVPTSLSLNVAGGTTATPGNNNTGSEKITASWTKPSDHDTTTSGIQTTPYISIYKISYTPTSTTRFNNFGALYGGSALSTNENLAYNPNTEPTSSSSNASTNENLISLFPSTTYSVKVAAKNAQNANYGSYSSSETATTNSVNAPDWLDSNDANQLSNVNNLKNPYSGDNAYKIDGSGTVPFVININNVNGTNNNLEIRTNTATGIRTNNTVSDGASANLGTASAFGGVDGSEETVSKTIPVFNADASNYLSNQDVDTGTKVILRIENEHDHYFKSHSGSPAFHGFYKSVDLYAKAKNPATTFPPSLDKYTLQVKYSANGGSSYNGGEINFGVDDINVDPSIDSNFGIISEVGSSSIQQISGVYAYNTNAVFRSQFNISEIGHYYLRSDRKHADIEIYSSNLGTLKYDDFTLQDINTNNGYGGTHFFYTAPGSNTYTTSTTKYNTNGTSLPPTSTPPALQINSFHSVMSGATNKFTDDIQLKLKAYNIRGTGNNMITSSGAFMNTTDGTRKYIRFDSSSVSHINSTINSATNSRGQHINSKTGQYPDLGTGTTYDHTQSITAGDYAEELQLVGGSFRVATDSDAYKNYSTGFYNSNSAANPNYSTVDTSASTFRYVTFKYTNIISSSGTSKIRLTINGTSINNITIDPSTPGSGNHRLYVKVVSSNSDYTTPWLDATEAIPGVGINSSSANGTGCLDSTSSTSSQRDCFIITGTTNGTVFVRLGLKGNHNSNTKITYINVSAL